MHTDFLYTSVAWNSIGFCGFLGFQAKFISIGMSAVAFLVAPCCPPGDFWAARAISGNFCFQKKIFLSIYFSNCFSPKLFFHFQKKFPTFTFLCIFGCYMPSWVLKKNFTPNFLTPIFSDELCVKQGAMQCCQASLLSLLFFVFGSWYFVGMFWFFSCNFQISNNWCQRLWRKFCLLQNDSNSGQLFLSSSHAQITPFSSWSEQRQSGGYGCHPFAICNLK